MHTKDGVADQFIKDVTDEVANIMKAPSLPVEGKVIRAYSRFICHSI